MFLEISNSLPKNPASYRESDSADKLWLEIRENKKESLSRLFCLYYDKLYKYGYKIVPNDELIKDCIQELFLSIWRSRRNLDGAKSVKSYIFCSFRRTIFRELNKQKTRSERNRKYIEDFFENSTNIEDLIILFETQKEHSELLSTAIQSLGYKQKKVIHLKYFEGMANDEIAAIMSIKRQSVYNHVCKAIQTLKSFVHPTVGYRIR